MAVLNYYLYAGANPIISIDPQGLFDFNAQFWIGVSEVALGAAGEIAAVCTSPFGIGIAGFVLGASSIYQGIADFADSQSGERHTVNPVAVIVGDFTALTTGNAEITDAVTKYTPLAASAFMGVSGFIGGKDALLTLLPITTSASNTLLKNKSNSGSSNGIPDRKVQDLGGGVNGNGVGGNIGSTGSNTSAYGGNAGNGNGA